MLRVSLTTYRQHVLDIMHTYTHYQLSVPEHFTQPLLHHSKSVCDLFLSLQ